jgi:hypothetical protein
MRSVKILVLFAFALLVIQGCAASRTEMTGKFNLPSQVNADADKVSVFFHFRHMTQQHGWDSIPKLQAQGVKDFNNLFRDSLVEINNISRYDTFTESPADVDSPARREELETFKKANDYTISVDFFEESSFKQQCFSGIISLCSLTIIPMPYTWDYTITANVTDKNGKLLRSYNRKASLNQWTQVLLMFAYPFYPYEGKREEIYSEALHDIFSQIETEKILKKQG